MRFRNIKRVAVILGLSIICISAGCQKIESTTSTFSKVDHSRIIHIKDESGCKVCKDRFILSKSSNVDNLKFDSLAKEFLQGYEHLVAVQQLGGAGDYLIQFNGDEDQNQILSEKLVNFSNVLKQNDVSAHLTPDYAITGTQTTTDYSKKQIEPDVWWLETTEANKVWSKTQGDGVIVVVLDSGVNYNHPDISGNIWSAPANLELLVENKPLNFPIKKGDHGINVLEEGTVKMFDPMDDGPKYHGTAISGVIAALENNVGVIGISPKATILPIKILNGEAIGCVSSLILALDLMKQLEDQGIPIKVVNNSYALDTDTPPEEIKDLREKMKKFGNQIFVVSAGNQEWDLDEKEVYPSSFGYEKPESGTAELPNFLSVTAITKGNSMVTDANFGKCSVDLAAPGDSILTTYGNYYSTQSSTSIATPFVSGAAALVASKCTQEPVEIIKILRDYAVHEAALDDKVLGGKRLNICRALAACIKNKKEKPICATFLN